MPLLHAYVIFNPTQSEIRAAQQVAIDKILQIAVNDLKKPRDQLVIRHILPKTDLGFSNETWAETISSANAFNTIVDDKNFDNKKVMTIYGFANLAANPLTTEVKITSGADVKALIHIEDMYLYPENPVCILKQPLLFGGDETFDILQYATSTGTDNLMYLGYIVEPVGRTISSPKAVYTR